jgi:hypothetical protein
MTECEIDVLSSDGSKKSPGVVRFFRDGLGSTVNYLQRCGYKMSGRIQVYVLPECTQSVGGVYYGHEDGTHFMTFPSRVVSNGCASYLAHEVVHAAHAENTVEDCGEVWSRVQNALQDPINNIRPQAELPASVDLLIAELVALHGELRWVEHELGKQYSPFDTNTLIRTRQFLHRQTRTSQFVDPATMTYDDCYLVALRLGERVRLKHFPKMKGSGVVRTFLNMDWDYEYYSDYSDAARKRQLATLLQNPSSIVFINGNTIADEFPAGNRNFYRRKSPKNAI